MTYDIDKVSEIRDYLNDITYDPLSTDRVGSHFYTFEDDLNLNRGNTFPKGVILKEDPDVSPKSFGHSPYQEELDTFIIWYYVKAGQKITRPDNSNTVKNGGFCSYMLGRIKESLLDDTREYITFGGIISVKQVGSIVPVTSPNSKFTLWRGSVMLQILGVNN